MKGDRFRQRLGYLLTSTRKSLLGEGFSCPSCGCRESTVVSRKYLVTTLRRCGACRLQFRAPTTGAEQSARFYQQDYSEGFTTDCPSDRRLAELLEQGFAGGEKDFSRYIEVIRAAGGEPGQRLFDFGCSWGYGSWQLARQGFEVESFEISAPRARYAREKLGVKVNGELPDEEAGFDIFFSSHVLEHVPSVKRSIEQGMRLLKPGGLFVAFTPNGSARYREVAAESWRKMWGRVHPGFLDECFYQHHFVDRALFIAATPCSPEAIERWSVGEGERRRIGDLEGSELMLLVRK